MQLNLSGQHVELTPALREYVRSKLDRLERHFDHVTNAKVVLSVEKQVQRADASINVSRAQLNANAVGEDMYAAIDALVDKLDRQILKHKGKIGDHRRTEAPVIDTTEEPLS